MMGFEQLPHAGLGAGHELHGVRLNFQADRVNKDFRLSVTRTGRTWPMCEKGTEYRLASMRDVAIDADMAIDDLGGVEVAAYGSGKRCGNSQLMSLERRLALKVAQRRGHRRRSEATTRSPR